MENNSHNLPGVLTPADMASVHRRAAVNHFRDKEHSHALIHINKAAHIEARLQRGEVFV